MISLYCYLWFHTAPYLLPRTWSGIKNRDKNLRFAFDAFKNGTYLASNIRLICIESASVRRLNGDPNWKRIWEVAINFHSRTRFTLGTISPTALTLKGLRVAVSRHLLSYSFYLRSLVPTYFNRSRSARFNPISTCFYAYPLRLIH